VHVIKNLLLPKPESKLERFPRPVATEQAAWPADPERLRWLMVESGLWGSSATRPVQAVHPSM